jgi:hypothetical protein
MSDRDAETSAFDEHTRDLGHGRLKISDVLQGHERCGHVSRPARERKMARIADDHQLPARLVCQVRHR